MKTWLAALLLLFSGTATADILQWQDAQGVWHYTNLEGEVPAEYRATASKVVDENVRRPHDDSTTKVSPLDVGEQAPRMAQVVYERPPQSDAYAEGLRRGLRLQRSDDRRRVTNIEINGPLAVAEATATAPQVAYPHGPWHLDRGPLVTTSFDRGRSRHRTLRMLVQDRLAAEREGVDLYGTRYGVRLRPEPVSVDIDRRVLRRWRQTRPETQADQRVAP